MQYYYYPYPSKSLMISSKLFPLVSGRHRRMKIAPINELMAKRKVAPCMPMFSNKAGRY